MKVYRAMTLLVLVSSVAAQPFDWMGDMTLFGTVQEEHNPCLSAIGAGNWFAFCMIEPDTLAMKCSSDNGQSWTDASRLPGMSTSANIVSASDATYCFLFRNVVGTSTKHMYRFASSAGTWGDATELDLAPERQADVACMTATTDAMIQPDDSYLSLCWRERAEDGTLTTLFTQSRDHGTNFLPAVIIDSSSAPAEMPATASIAVTWSGEEERIHVAIPVDRPGSMPEQLQLFASEDQGAHWSAGTAIDSSEYAQRNPSLAGFEATLFLVYCKRIDVTPQRDVFFSYSPDGGLNFSPPIAVADSALDESEPRVIIDPAAQLFHVFFMVSDVFSDTASLMVRTGAIAAPWLVGPAFPVSTPESVVRTGGLSVSSNPSGVAAAWSSPFQLGDTDVRFDASWRTTSVPNQQDVVPPSFAITNAYPNPFNGVTRITVDIQYSRYVELVLTDILGRRLGAPYKDVLQSGRTHISLDLSGYASGTYWLTCSQFPDVSRRIVLLR